MTPLERKELDSLMKLFKRQADNKRLPEAQRSLAKAHLNVLTMLRNRLRDIEAKRKGFKLIAGGRL